MSAARRCGSGGRAGVRPILPMGVCGVWIRALQCTQSAVGRAWPTWGVECAAVPAGTEPVSFQLCDGVFGGCRTVCGVWDVVDCRISLKGGPSVLEAQRLAARDRRVQTALHYALNCRRD